MEGARALFIAPPGSARTFRRAAERCGLEPLDAAPTSAFSHRGGQDLPALLCIGPGVPDNRWESICRRTKLNRRHNPVPVLVCRQDGPPGPPLDHIRVEPDRYLRPTTDSGRAVRIIEGFLEDFRDRSADRTAFRLDAVVGSDLGLLGEVASLVDPVVGMTGLPGSERRHVRYATLEMALNAMEWGNRWERKRAVRFHFELDADRFVLCISDEGPGFDADAVMERESRPINPEVQMDKRREAGRRFGGYGVRVCREFVDELHYNKPGNEVTLIKYLETQP